jgi:hypothetical protein
MDATIQIPELTKIQDSLKKLEAQLQILAVKIQPSQEYYDLKEACSLKGINYDSISNTKYAYLQPNNGIPDKEFVGRKRWHRTTIEVWLHQCDTELKALQKSRKSTG